MESTSQPEIGLVGRMIRIFYAPSQTFEAVAEQRSAADWLVPTIILVVVVSITTYLTLPIQMAERREMMQRPPLESEEVTQFVWMIGGISGMISGLVMAFVMLFISAALYLLVGKLLGGLLDYGQALAIAAYTSLISGLRQIVTTPLVLANKTMNVQTGLGVFLSEEARESFGGILLSSIEPFTVWTVIVTGVGLSIVGQIERSRAYAAVAAITLVFIIIAAIFVTLLPSYLEIDSNT